MAFVVTPLKSTLDERKDKENGVNYNQVVRELKSRFSEKKAMALLYKLEETTRQLVAVNREIIALTQKFEQEWLRTSM